LNIHQQKISFRITEGLNHLNETYIAVKEKEKEE
jgi:hypothetical protein